MYDEVLEDLSKIEGWFSADLFYNESTPDSDKVTILEILLHEYAEIGLLEARLIGGEWCFMHPSTMNRLYREHQIDRLLNKSFSECSGIETEALPLPKVDALTMIDARQLNLSQLKQKLGVEKEEGVKRWLRKHGIPLVKRGREKVAREFLVELALQTELVEELMIVYPDSWFKIYAAKSNCERMTKAIFTRFPPKKKIEMKKTLNPYTKRIS
jgi:hypothetical protein